MKLDLAEKGIFNQPNLTPIRSVELTNMHDVLYYFNVQAIKDKESEN